MADSEKLSEKIIDLELSSICNLDCIFCPRDKIKRSRPFIEMETVDRLIPLIDENKVVWFSGMGEPFLHPGYSEIVKRIKTSNAKVYTNTNASAPHFKEKLESAVDEGLSFVNVSVYGYDKEDYFSTSRRDVFNIFLDNVKFLQNLELPYRLSYVVPLDLDKEKVRKRLEDTFETDRIRLLPQHHRSFSLEEQPNSKCAITEFYLFISCDGDVLSCVNDVSGKNNFGKNILKASEEKRKRYPFNSCEHCDEPHKTLPYKEGYFQKVFELDSKIQKIINNNSL